MPFKAEYQAANCSFTNKSSMAMEMKLKKTKQGSCSWRLRVVTRPWFRRGRVKIKAQRFRLPIHSPSPRPPAVTGKFPERSVGRDHHQYLAVVQGRPLEPQRLPSFLLSSPPSISSSSTPSFPLETPQSRAAPSVESSGLENKVKKEINKNLKKQQQQKFTSPPPPSLNSSLIHL